MNPTQMENYLDPNVIKKGVEQIKDQMREVQQEAHQIESDMESRFKDLLMKHESQKRQMPHSLTSELDNQAQNLKDEIAKVPSFNKTRDLVIERLGGPFDYYQFQEDIRLIKVEKDQLARKFKNQALERPVLSVEDFGGKAAFYDFST